MKIDDVLSEDWSYNSDTPEEQLKKIEEALEHLIKLYSTSRKIPDVASRQVIVRDLRQLLEVLIRRQYDGGLA